MKKTLFILFVWIMFFSCDTTKKAIKSKKETTTQNDIAKESSEVIETKREGGTLKTDIIPYEERERDANGDIKELVQTLKDGGLTKTIYYKPDGKVDVECTADEIWTRIEKKLNERDNSLTEKQSKDKDQLKEVDFQSEIILYGFIGLALIVAVIAFFGFRFLGQNTKALNTVLEQITK